MRRLVGGLAAAIGLCGIALSVAAVVATWTTAVRLGREATDLLGQLAAVVSAASAQADSAVLVLDAASDQVGAVREAVDHLGDRGELPDDLLGDSLIEALDQDVDRWLDIAEQFVRSMQEGMRNASGTLAVLDSVPLLSGRLVRSPDGASSQLRVLARNLEQLSRELDRATAILAEVRARRSIDPRQLDRLRTALTIIDGRLAEVRGEIAALAGQIGQVARRLASLEHRAPRLLGRTAAFATAFFACFAASQAALVALGWRALRPGPAPAADGPAAVRG